MEDIKDILHEGGTGHSLVIKTASDDVFSFDGRGISDLMRLLNASPDMLHGARLADKVVGKAAAALMVLGGVGELQALLISDGALRLLRGTGMKVSYDKRVDHIVNRDGTDWCPMEKACHDCLTAEECLERIKKTINQLI